MTGNVQGGIQLTNGLINNCVFTGNGFGGNDIRGAILVAPPGTVTVTGNTITNNAMLGLLAPSYGTAAVVGYGGNTFSNNGQDVTLSPGFSSMKNNVGANGVF